MLRGARRAGWYSVLFSISSAILHVDFYVIPTPAFGDPSSEGNIIMKFKHRLCSVCKPRIHSPHAEGWHAKHDGVSHLGFARCTIFGTLRYVRRAKPRRERRCTVPPLGFARGTIAPAGRYQVTPHANGKITRSP